MIKVLLILISIAILELAVIIFLVWLLIRKREKQIVDYNETIVTREKAEQQIKDKYKEKEKQLEEDIKKALINAKELFSKNIFKIAFSKKGISVAISEPDKTFKYILNRTRRKLNVFNFFR